MMTTVYFIRHAHSPYIPGMERTKGLSDRGRQDAAEVARLLKDEGIDVLVSSTYDRAILTIKDLAEELGLDIRLEEDLRERRLADEGYVISDEQFFECKRKLYEDWDYAFPGGESGKQAQSRAVSVLQGILEQYRGKKIGIGTHGDIMTLMMNYFDSRYNYTFWQSLSMPDIYQLEFEENKLIRVTRRWGSGIS